MILNCGCLVVDAMMSRPCPEHAARYEQIEREDAMTDQTDDRPSWCDCDMKVCECEPDVVGNLQAMMINGLQDTLIQYTRGGVDWNATLPATMREVTWHLPDAAVEPERPAAWRPDDLGATQRAMAEFQEQTLARSAELDAALVRAGEAIRGLEARAQLDILTAFDGGRDYTRIRDADSAQWSRTHNTAYQVLLFPGVE